MRITKEQLKQIIKEELEAVLNETAPFPRDKPEKVAEAIIGVMMRYDKAGQVGPGKKYSYTLSTPDMERLFNFDLQGIKGYAVNYVDHFDNNVVNALKKAGVGVEDEMSGETYNFGGVLPEDYPDDDEDDEF